MTNIEKVSCIPREALSGEHYFQSLLEQGYRGELLSRREFEQIQFACITLLANKTERFNGGDSSSIRVEKAQDILASLMFTIGAELKTYPCPDDALAAIQRYGIEAVYTAGFWHIDYLLTQAKARHAALVSQLLQTPNTFYAATIVDGIKGFFKLYYPDFAAQEIHITADYPVYNRTERLLGIEFIGQYLQQLYLENQFLVHFMADDIHHLLCGYDERYESLLFNLYEPVLAAALGCVIADTDASILEVTPAAQSMLHSRFTGMERSEIQIVLVAALTELSSRFSFSEELHAYVTASLPQLAATIATAAEMGGLNGVFITPRYPENDPKLVVSYGEKMDDALYRKVLAEFMGSRTAANRTDIMNEHFHSLNDLNDLLLDAELTADAIAALLKSRAPAEVAALLKKYTTHYEMSFTSLRDSEKTLYAGLQLFMSNLPAEQRMMLNNAVKMLEED